MAAIDVSSKQRGGLEFLCAEGKTPVRMHEGLKNDHGNLSVDVSSVRLCARHWGDAVGQSSLAAAEGAANCDITQY